MMTHEESSKIWRLIKNIDVAMLTTDSNSSLHARPLFTVQKDFDGTFWFITSEASARIDDIQDNKQVCLTYTREADGVYVSLSGTAALIYDKVLIEKFWNSTAEGWFGKGMDDPDAILLEVHVERAELWDAKTNIMTILFEPMVSGAYDENSDLTINSRFNQH